MSNSLFSIKISNIRAVQEAEIDIKGITVLTGTNGCGKSTISKLFYGFLDTIINYDDYVESKYRLQISPLVDILDAISPSNLFFDSIRERENWLNLHFWKEFFDQYIDLYSEPQSISKAQLKRLISLYKGITNNDVSDIKEPSDLINAVKTALMNRIINADNDKQKRPDDILVSNYASLFREKNPSWKYQFYEYGKALIGRDNSIEKQQSFSNIIYIDTPYGTDETFRSARNSSSYHSKLHTCMKRLCMNGSINEQLLDYIQNIINGDVYSNSLSSNFIFTSRNGDKYDLTQCATGIKAFSILDLLCKNGYFNESTLLIIDEPEAHLHPQWIVEYARLVVYMYKLSRVKFLIATHNPDFVSALKYISENENLEEDLNFYLAENSASNPAQFVFKKQGTNIEKIFASFNIALERINQYGNLD